VQHRQPPHDEYAVASIVESPGPSGIPRKGELSEWAIGR
jgi:hypothetical protein